VQNYSALTALNTDSHNSCSSMDCVGLHAGNNIVSRVENALFSHHTLHDVVACLTDEEV